jgi:4-methyl-5(b-hydroxyethyl)-thiazole monophosphate biosynthesis
MKFACLLANGFEETEAISVIDVLRRANIEVDLVSISNLEVTGSHHIKLIADKVWENMEDYDGVFCPGGQPGTNNLMNDSRVISLIQSMHKKEKWITAICAAPLVLEKAGILVGKKVTSYPLQDLILHFQESIYCEDAVVRDGRIITSRGMGTAMHLGFAIIEACGMDSSALQKSTIFLGKL